MDAKVPIKKTASARGRLAVKASRCVYMLGDGVANGAGSAKGMLGNKGAEFDRLARGGVPIPPGFTIAAEAGVYQQGSDRAFPPWLRAQIETAVANLERSMGAKFGARKGRPLLLVIRPSAQHRMPGRMDTIFNVGLNDDSVIALSKLTSSPQFAWDCYLRFIQTYGEVVLGVHKRENEERDPFEAVTRALKIERNCARMKFEEPPADQSVVDAYVGGVEITADDQKELVRRFKALVHERTGTEFPSDPWDQLRGVIDACFGSWGGEHASACRRKHNIPLQVGLAASVQAVVFGNTGDDSGWGVAAPRDFVEGEGEVPVDGFLVNYHCSGFHFDARSANTEGTLRTTSLRGHPAYSVLNGALGVLKQRFPEVRRAEFIIQNGKFFVVKVHTDSARDPWSRSALKFYQRASGGESWKWKAREQFVFCPAPLALKAGLTLLESGSISSGRYLEILLNRLAPADHESDPRMPGNGLYSWSGRVSGPPARKPVGTIRYWGPDSGVFSVRVEWKLYKLGDSSRVSRQDPRRNFLPWGLAYRPKPRTQSPRHYTLGFRELLVLPSPTDSATRRWLFAVLRHDLERKKGRWDQETICCFSHQLSAHEIREVGELHRRSFGNLCFIAPHFPIVDLAFARELTVDAQARKIFSGVSLARPLDPLADLIMYRTATKVDELWAAEDLLSKDSRLSAFRAFRITQILRTIREFASRPLRSDRHSSFKHIKCEACRLAGTADSLARRDQFETSEVLMRALSLARQALKRFKAGHDTRPDESVDEADELFLQSKAGNVWIGDLGCRALRHGEVNLSPLGRKDYRYQVFALNCLGAILRAAHARGAGTLDRAKLFVTEEGFVLIILERGHGLMRSPLIFSIYQGWEADSGLGFDLWSSLAGTSLSALRRVSLQALFDPMANRWTPDFFVRVFTEEALVSEAELLRMLRVVEG
jgi:hypothetical protein